MAGRYSLNGEPVLSDQFPCGLLQFAEAQVAVIKFVLDKRIVRFRVFISRRPSELDLGSFPRQAENGIAVVVSLLPCFPFFVALGKLRPFFVREFAGRVEGRAWCDPRIFLERNADLPSSLGTILTSMNGTPRTIPATA